MATAVQKKYGALNTLTLTGRNSGPAVVLFHGYGADASDLLPLADYMNLPSDVTWIFPEAPVEVIIAPGYFGKAWYQIDIKRLENAMLNGQPVDLSSMTPPGLENARQCAASLYDEVLKQHGKVIVGGFSQGAMLATELTLTHKRKPDGLVIMSGSLICADRWKKFVPSAKAVSFIQSHGKNDVILGYEFAEKLYSFLSDNELQGEFVPFSGGHEIPPKVIDKISSYLRALVR